MVDSRSEAIWARTLSYLETALDDVRVVEADCVTQEEAARGYKPERTPLECSSVGGVCSVCYGPEPGTASFPPTGAPVGQWAVAALRHPDLAPERHAPGFYLGEWPYELAAESTGKVSVDVPDGLALDDARDSFLGSPFCLVVRDPDGSGAAVRVHVEGQPTPLLLYEESRLLVFPGDTVEAGQKVAYRRPAWERPFKGRLRLLADWFEARSRPPRAVLSPFRGVLRIRPLLDGKVDIFVESDGHPEFVGCLSKNDLDSCLRDGDFVIYGEKLSDGNVWPRDYLNRSAEETASWLIDGLTPVLDANRMAVDPRVIRLVVARMLCYRRIDEAPPQGPWRVGQVEDSWVIYRSSAESRARDGVVSHTPLVLGARLMARVARAIRAERGTSGNSVP